MELVKQIKTAHIQGLLQGALANASLLHDQFIPQPELPGVDLKHEEQSKKDHMREGLIIAIRKAEHAVAELKAELHKVEYGYDIS